MLSNKLNLISKSIKPNRAIKSIHLRPLSTRVANGIQYSQPKTILSSTLKLSTHFKYQISGYASTPDLGNLLPPEKVRNIAIIAHVDHGKTTLVDCLLKQSGTLQGSHSDQNRVMDSNDLERERGITILSKCTSIMYKGHRINIVDTPGHADFGGEVERILSMVDGVALVVDATEGPMTQTKFVLSKALERGLKPLVVLNKADRPTSRAEEVDSELFDLFATLGATDEQMDYNIIYASAKEGWSTFDMEDERKDMTPLYETMLKQVPHPKVDRDAPFSMLVTQLESNSFLGKCYLGKIETGTIKVGDSIKALDTAGKVMEEGRITKIFLQSGLEKVIVDKAGAGDIVSISGLAGASVNSTLCFPSVTEPLPSNPIDPPTVSMDFFVNDSPLAGQEGNMLTSTVIGDRLRKEAETNVALQIHESAGKDRFEVRGRGELQLGVLIETMRREGFELSISPPRVVYQKGESGELMEPIEEVTIDVDPEYSGTVIEKLSKRKGDIKEFTEFGEKSRLIFEVPTRGLLGYGAEFKNDTHGEGVLNHVFSSYQSFKGSLDQVRKGSLISTSKGDVTTYAAGLMEPRGKLFVTPGMSVYPGMIVGEYNKDGDLEVNPTRTKGMQI
jgi:GTP-binding protein